MAKPKYSLELRLEVAHHYLSDKDGKQHTAAFFGIERTSVLRWVRAWQLYGIDGIPSKNYHHSPAFRLVVAGNVLSKNFRCAKLQHSLISQMKPLFGTGSMSIKRPARKNS
ncbi:MAG: transposase [Leclercia adecarboxylata]|nr:transposase [Leclercia adecarboxylata]